MKFSLRIKISLIYGFSGFHLLGTTFKDTTTVIQEWIQTEQLISEETSEWNIEKAALLYQDVLKIEIIELDKRLKNPKRKQGQQCKELNCWNKK